MITNLTTISVKQLKRAVALQERIEKLQIKLAGILGETGASAAPVKGRHGGRRNMSAAARERIAAAQRARWAKLKGTTGATPAAKTGRRKMSPAARAKIAAAARARWAKAKAANRNSLAAV